MARVPEISAQFLLTNSMILLLISGSHAIGSETIHGHVSSKELLAQVLAEELNHGDKVLDPHDQGIDAIALEGSISESSPDIQEENDLEGSSHGSCKTLPSLLHVTKDEQDQNGQLVRTCQGNVEVTKCEGYCSSQLYPSVTHPTGFMKVMVFSIKIIWLRTNQ